jgi:tetratricopeptide (TPR) repeat protein
VIHPFPLFKAAHSLSRHDFRNFYLPFSKVIKDKVLTAGNVVFLEDGDQIDDLVEPGLNLPLLKDFFETTIRTHAPTGHGHCLFLPFLIDTQQSVVALLTGLDPFFVKKLGHDWLQDTRDTLQQEFLTLKQAGVDLQTGLLNGVHLSTLFDTCPEGEHIGLVLVEIYPKVRTAMEDMQHVRRSAATLKSFTGDHIPLYHIGQSVFAYPCRNCDENSAAGFIPLLVSYLKREQFKRVHVGYSQGTISRNPDQDKAPDQPGTSGRQILDQAWLALQTACKRGPFNFCTYHSLQHAQRHPLYASHRNILARIKPHWQQLDRFSLVQIHGAGSLENLHDEIVLPPGGGTKIKVSDTDVYLLLPTTDSSEVIAGVEAIFQSFTSHQRNRGFLSAGIAGFPFGSFRKTEIPTNCRKALLHGELLGPGKITVFDALSLNVSGDIFYGEGDIPRAIKEYKKGLTIAPDDVNLLNSLGVSYAMLNRHHGAIDCFLKALTIKRDDFISCYNLGLERKLQGNIAGAVQSFEHALQCRCEDQQDTENARKELPLQLGKLYCQTARYEETLDILLPWYASERINPGSGRAFRYLGESFHGVGRDQEAMIWLQRAIRFDEFDADALSLLGEIYLANNEGDEIALKLCEKSVELNQMSPLLYLRLAKAQIQCGQLETARENLKPCLRNKALQEEAGFQMGFLSFRQGQRTRARSWFSKTLDHARAGTRLHTLATGYLKEIEASSIHST